MKWPDRILGIVLGVVLGVGVIVVFVFVYSERTVDAPSISQNGNRSARGGGARSGGGGVNPSRPPVATVRAIGGAPPAGGPAGLDYRKGDLVRLRVVSDQTIDVELVGYGISRTVPFGQPETIAFDASKPGSFPLLATASHIDLARITVRGRTP